MSEVIIDLTIDTGDTFFCPTHDWWRYERGHESTFAGPYKKSSVQYEEVVKILQGDENGFRWQHILCKDTLGDYARKVASRMEDEKHDMQVFMAHAKPYAKTVCNIILAVMVCSLKSDKVAYVDLLCSGVPGVGEKLLKFALIEMKEEEVNVVKLKSTDGAIAFYKRHGFQNSDKSSFELRL
jgi:hypothetical protein